MKEETFEGPVQPIKSQSLANYAVKQAFKDIEMLTNQRLEDLENERLDYNQKRAT